MSSWSGRLKPRTFSILGGEPAINPHLSSIADAAIRHWPDSRLRVVTNGFLLTRHPELPSVMAKAKEAVLQVSMHHGSDAYQEKFRPVRLLLEDWGVRFSRLKIEILEAEPTWTRRYEVEGRRVTFSDSDPRTAWRACIGKSCMQLFDNHLWKCPPIAYLKLLSAKREVPASVAALGEAYMPLSPDASCSELCDFLRREDEGICRMCPEQLIPFQLKDPLAPLMKAAVVGSRQRC